MTVFDKFIDIVKTMVEHGMIDKDRLFDKEYVFERVNLYLEAKSFVNNNFKGYL